MRSLGGVLDEDGLDHVDLLKVDVEGSEIAVLEGLEDRHWAGIRAVSIEEDKGLAAGVEGVSSLPSERGFLVELGQSSPLPGTSYWTVASCEPLGGLTCEPWNPA